MTHFQHTPNSILSQARKIFLSERFTQAYEILSDCFDDSQVTNEQVFALLKGDLGLIENDDGTVELSSDAIDLEFKRDMDEVLFNYDFIYQHEGKYYQVSRALPIDLDAFVNNNVAITALKTNELIKPASYEMFSAIKDIEMSIGINLFFEDAELLIYVNKHIVILELFDKTYFKEFAKNYSSPKEAAQAFLKSMEG